METYRNPDTQTSLKQYGIALLAKKLQDEDRIENNVKVFLRYVDDILRTVKGDPGIVLEAVNKLHPNLQFTIEELDRNGNLAFLFLNINVDSGKKATCGWYQKPTDTGTILNFRGCAPLQYKRNFIEGTVHRVFRSTSTWENFDQALKKNRKQWIENQYPKNWSDMVVFETLNKIIEGKKKLEVRASETRNNYWFEDSPPFYNAISSQVKSSFYDHLAVSLVVISNVFFLSPFEFVHVNSNRFPMFVQFPLEFVDGLALHCFL